MSTRRASISGLRRFLSRVVGLSDTSMHVYTDGIPRVMPVTAVNGIVCSNSQCYHRLFFFKKNLTSQVLTNRTPTFSVDPWSLSGFFFLILRPDGQLSSGQDHEGFDATAGCAIRT
jgi:hypothetical protein